MACLSARPKYVVGVQPTKLGHLRDAVAVMIQWPEDAAMQDLALNYCRDSFYRVRGSSYERVCRKARKLAAIPGSIDAVAAVLTAHAGDPSLIVLALSVLHDLGNYGGDAARDVYIPLTVLACLPLLSTSDPAALIYLGPRGGAAKQAAPSGDGDDGQGAPAAAVADGSTSSSEAQP
jgi:hypothetical protein